MIVDRKYVWLVSMIQQLCQREGAGNLERTNNRSVQPDWHLHEYTEIIGNSHHGVQKSSFVYYTLPLEAQRRGDPTSDTTQLTVCPIWRSETKIKLWLSSNSIEQHHPLIRVLRFKLSGQAEWGKRNVGHLHYKALQLMLHGSAVWFDCITRLSLEDIPVADSCLLLSAKAV